MIVEERKGKMAKLKCYSTMTIFTPNEEFRKKYQFQPHVRQFTVVCLTTSYKKANEWAESLGLGKNVFQSQYTYVLNHPELIEECQKHGGFIIETNKHNQYVSIQEALRKREV